MLLGMTGRFDTPRDGVGLSRHCEGACPWQSSAALCISTEVDPHVATLLGMTFGSIGGIGPIKDLYPKYLKSLLTKVEITASQQLADYPSQATE